MAAKRVISQCGQQSHVLSKLLKRNGIQSYLIGLSGHVVTGALVEIEQVIMDADYGIFIPIGIDEIQDVDIEYYYSKLTNIYTDSVT